MSDYSHRRNFENTASVIPKEDYINNIVMSHNDLSQSSEDIKRAKQIVGPNSHVAKCITLLYKTIIHPYIL